MHQFARSCAASAPVLNIPGMIFNLQGLDLGRAMIQATIENIHGRIIENPEIRDIAERYVSHTY
jgi:hypothetical protein